MTTLQPSPAAADVAADQPAVPARRIVNAAVLAGIAGTTLFIATEAYAAAVLSAWAVGGLFHFGKVATLVLGAVLVAGATAATVAAARLAWQAETHPDNN
ncbi:MAG: hypothetical protein CMJ42_14600 [Phyllobacteriaceae bacterium]|nr:hypothetical protein [Phyllobacteriaceae bacterium]MBA89379.1 hypothetical protein [Phyllobacteriaceae bacterium]